MKIIIALLALLFSNALLYAQSPIPLADECSTAILLSAGSSCSMTSYTTAGTTASSGVPNPNCSGYLGMDGWMQVIVPASGHLQFRLSSATTTGWNIYTSDCNTFTTLFCKNGNGFFNLHNPALAGTTLYIRVYRWNQPSAVQFDFCVWEPSTVDHDFCTNALPINVDTACNLATYNNIGATAESISISPNPLCGGYQGGDVWFQFVMPASGKIRIECEDVSNISPSFEVLSGSCGNFTKLGCVSISGALNLNQLGLAGQTLYIRVWDFNASNITGGGIFQLCVWEPPTPPNDFCAQAIPLPVGTTCQPNTYQLVGCTAEPITVAPNPSCGFYQGNDMWFSVQVPASGQMRIEHLGSNSLAFALYSGTCGNLTQLNCGQLNTKVFNINNPALANQVLYVRVWTFNSSEINLSFQICAEETSPAANDFCAAAIPLSVNASCVWTKGYIEGCTAEPLSVAPNPSCGSYQGNDVWYSFTMPPSGHLKVEKVNDADIAFALYVGSCGNFTQVDCAQLGTNFINIHDNNLANQTMYIRVWTYSSASLIDSFSLCLTEPNTPDNDFCSAALPLTITQTCNLNTYSFKGCTKESTSVAPNPTCGAFVNGDIWFSFTMPASGLLTVITAGGPADAQVALYTGSCGAMTQFACTQFLNATQVNQAALAGQPILLRLWDYSSPADTTFQLCVYEPLCLILIDSISANPSSCNIVADGSLQVFANCASCAGSLEYSINNGPYQTSPVFNNISSGVYQVKVRDQGNANCFATFTGFLLPTQQAAHFYFVDNDNDGYGTNPFIQSCSPIAGYVQIGGDCNDNNPAVHPGQNEIPCNSLDENCNGMNDDTPSEFLLSGLCREIVNAQNASMDNGSDFGNQTLNSTNAKSFRIHNDDNQPLYITNMMLSGIHAADFSYSGINLPDTILPNQFKDVLLHFTPSALGLREAEWTIYNNDCDEYAFQAFIQGTGVTTTFIQLNLQAFVEGYYSGAGSQTTTLLNQGIQTCPDICDSIVVSFHDEATYQEVQSVSCIMQTNGQIPVRMPTLIGSYFIVLRHRNGVEVWSATAMPILNQMTYSFTTASSQVYGENVLEVESGIWAIYSGDINSDSVVDGLDFNDWENDSNNFISGFFDTDINGDGIVDGLDFLFWETNSNAFVGLMSPSF